MAKTGLLSASKQAGAGGGTVGSGDIAISKAGTGCGQSIEVWSRDVFAAMEADVGVPHVIADDHQNVGSGGCLDEERPAEGEQ